MENELCCVYCEHCEKFIDGYCYGYYCDMDCIHTDCEMMEELEKCFKEKTGK